MKLVQGDSYGVDFTSPDEPVLDADYTGSWAIVPELGKTAVASGDMAQSADNTAFELRITPDVTEALPPRRYWLVVEISNEPLGYRKEIVQKEFTIAKQGIPAP